MADLHDLKSKYNEINDCEIALGQTFRKLRTKDRELEAKTASPSIRQGFRFEDYFIPSSMSKVLSSICP